MEASRRSRKYRWKRDRAWLDAFRYSTATWVVLFEHGRAGDPRKHLAFVLYDLAEAV